LAEAAIPYLSAYGNITKVLNKIRTASTPPRFTQDFLATTLDMPGGSAKPVIPFLKRIGFLGSDGTPTALYKRFRNTGESGAVVAEAMRTGFRPLYAINEYIHDASDAALKGAVIQATGAEEGSTTVKSIVGSFKALKAFADFDADPTSTPRSETTGDEDLGAAASGGAAGPVDAGLPAGLSLGYTINLHLPATSDVAVFNAIFKSLREHLLR